MVDLMVSGRRTQALASDFSGDGHGLRIFAKMPKAHRGPGTEWETEPRASCRSTEGTQVAALATDCRLSCLDTRGRGGTTSSLKAASSRIQGVEVPSAMKRLVLDDYEIVFVGQLKNMKCGRCRIACA